MEDIDINIDVKKEVKNLRNKVKNFDNYLDFNTVSYNDLVPFVFNLAKKFDKRLDAIEARLDAIDKAFQDSLARFPV